jgi:hypothetical protein
MTKEEMRALHEKHMARIKENGLPCRPISEADRNASKNSKPNTGRR